MSTENRKTKVVMLSADTSNITTGQIVKCKTENKHVLARAIREGNIKYDEPQHLYFLSEEEIKEGDYFINLIQYKEGYYIIHQHTNDKDVSGNHLKKIITTTNPELILSSESYKMSGGNTLSKNLVYLPRPSDKFIQKYIEEYNKGNVIEEVLVEYELIAECIHLNKCHCDIKYECNTFETKILKLKVAPDNTITIHPVEEDWDSIARSFFEDKNMNMAAAAGINMFLRKLKENYNPPTKKK